jgi:predicted TIM-barrel fold metal-dependent hydrolase
MTYAGDRVLLDADSHVMELPDFLTAHADPGVRDRIPPISFASGGKLERQLEAYAERRHHEPEVVETQRVLGDRLLTGAKGYEAIGAFDTAERSLALDQLGFERQFVFATFSTSVVFDVRLTPDVAAGAARAHNRAMAAFCDGEPRMIGVGATALDDVDAAVAEVDHIVSLGLGAVWVPHRAPGGRSPGHDDLDRFWAKVAEAGLPVLLHVGGHALQIDPAFMNTGRPVPGDWLGGGENVRGKDMIGLHHSAELFVGTMVLDGVFERHRDLRLGVIELGAGWVPSMLRRLDQIAGIWRRSEPELAALSRPPSQQLIEQAGFTPYPFEDVGAMIRESHPDLYLFSSDYPHIEGGRDPLGRFMSSLNGCDDDVVDKFLSGNMRRLLDPVRT